MGTKATNFFEDTFHFQLGLKALQSAVYWLTFADLNFGHTFTEMDRFKRGSLL
jgi:hypothetical protein